ncbi:hypothetical protein WG899_06495 [Paucibacter sp. AS339]|uniref:hypothetical protein n=1 Tax=Paucibacter hankyongi TaxID=3133434 RepID=UPI0030969C41
MAALALAGGLFMSPAKAQSYQVQNLSTNGMFAYGLNAKGQVTGSVPTDTSSSQAFLSGPNGEGVLAYTHLAGQATGNALNASGQIAGELMVSGGATKVQAFVTGAQGQNATMLGGLGGNVSTARGVNDSGTVIGFARNANNKFQAVKWLPNSSDAVQLANLGGDTSGANSINADGLIVGSSGLSDGSLHAVVWGLNGADITDLSTLGGRSSTAMAINGIGQVVGNSRVADGSLHAFITGAAAQGMSDLGTLGWLQSQASYINNAGMVAGMLLNGSDADSYLAGHVFITGPNGQGMVDLNSLVNVGQDLYLNDVWGLNDAGQLLVSDQNGNSYLLSPVPEAASWAYLLAGLLMLGLLGRTHWVRSVSSGSRSVLCLMPQR